MCRRRQTVRPPRAGYRRARRDLPRAEDAPTGRPARVCLVRRELDTVGTDKIERPFEMDPVYDDSDHVAVTQLANRPAGQGLWADVSDAGARRNAGKSRVRQDRHVLTERQVPQCRRDLKDFLHAGARRPSTHQYQNVARLDRFLALAFDRGDGVGLTRKDPRRPGFTIDSIGINDSRINGRALDHGTNRRQVASRECDSACEAVLLGPLRDS